MMEHIKTFSAYDFDILLFWKTKKDHRLVWDPRGLMVPPGVTDYSSFSCSHQVWDKPYNIEIIHLAFILFSVERFFSLPFERFLHIELFQPDAAGFHHLERYSSSDRSSSIFIPENRFNAQLIEPQTSFNVLES